MSTSHSRVSNDVHTDTTAKTCYTSKFFKFYATSAAEMMLLLQGVPTSLELGK